MKRILFLILLLSMVGCDPPSQYNDCLYYAQKVCNCGWVCKTIEEKECEIRELKACMIPEKVVEGTEDVDQALRDAG
jgi:hypothetical protein